MAANQPTVLPHEEWRPVPGYEGIYEVSSLGRVRSLPRERICKNGVVKKLKGKFLRQSESAGGYLKVGLWDERGGRTFHVHKVVMLGFVGEPPHGLEVRHLDGNNKNNTLDNLKYGTCSENHLDRVRHGTHSESRKTHCPRGHLHCDKNNCRSEKKRGGRQCLACHRAYGYLGYHPELMPKFQEIADAYYAQIMA